MKTKKKDYVPGKDAPNRGKIELFSNSDAKGSAGFTPRAPKTLVAVKKGSEHQRVLCLGWR